MNDDFDLGRLLDDAADTCCPHPDMNRFDALLVRRARARRATVVVGTAAAALLMGSAAFALRVDEQHRLGPAHPDQVSDPPPTTYLGAHTPFATVPKPEASTPSTVPTPGEPPSSGPTPTPAIAQPHPSQPKPTVPKGTEPQTTEPKTTEPKPTDPPTTSEPKYVLVAHQTYGSCGENPPYDIFYGTTKPGATVVIESAWSTRVEVHADATGAFEVQVEFSPDSPIGTPFKVTVTSGPYVQHFPFTHLAPTG